MKTLLLSLTVLTMLVSCGKNNAANSGVVTAGTNAVTVTDASAVALGNYVNSSENYFPAGLPVYYKYVYTTSTVSSSNGCTTNTSGGWIKFTYSVCPISSTTSGGTISYIPATADLAAKRVEIIGYINNQAGAGAVYQNSQYSYVIYTTAGDRVTIDFRYPLQANPVLIQSANGQIKIYSGYTTNY